MSEQQPIGILLISTRKYKQFVQPLIHSIDENFLNEHDKIIYVFTDKFQPELKSKSFIVQILIPDYKFPFASLYRYKIFDEHKFQLEVCSHLFYLDVDMNVYGKVGDEILYGSGLIAVLHPGYYISKKWGSPNCSKYSMAYLPEEERHNYYAGGFQGGGTKNYLCVCLNLKERIDADEKKEIMAEWGDETHWNFLLNSNRFNSILPVPFKKLTPEYCMVEQLHLREAWGISDLEPKIIALAKDHASIRS